MEELKMEVQEASIFIIKASIIRDIIKDVYALAKTIEWELRHTPASFRRAKKDSYKTKEMEVKLCELKFQKGIRMHIQFGDDDYIRNKLFLIIDKDGDSILNSIECNKFSDINYNRLKCNNPKYVCEDKEMGAIIYPDLKAAYVEESKVFIGEYLK